MIYVLLSAFNESENLFFWKTVAQVLSLKTEGHQINLIVAATRGTDSTIERLEELKVEVIVCHTVSRGERYDLGLKSINTDYEMLVFHHPRSYLQREGLLSLFNLEKKYIWGAFTHQFDFNHPLLIFTSWWSNNVRGDIKGIFYLDHCFYVRKELMDKIVSFPKNEIFEDTLFSLKLLQHSHPHRLPFISHTSAVRFISNGIWKQALRNQWLKCVRLFGRTDKLLNHTYERGARLNTPEKSDT